MKTTNKRTLTLTCAEGEEVTRKQHSCFIFGLVSDCASRKLFRWLRDKNDADTFFSHGLAEGSLITLQRLDSGVTFSYSRHGKQIYCASELGGDISNPNHLAALLHHVTCAVTVAEAQQKQEPLADAMNSLKPKIRKPEYHTTISDIFRAIDADDLVAMILDQPTVLSVGIAKSATCPARQQVEALIRAAVSYFQNVRRRSNGLVMQGFALRSLTDGRLRGHLVTSPMSRIANAYTNIQDDNHYASLKPMEAKLRFAADIVINLLAGVC